MGNYIWSNSEGTEDIPLTAEEENKKLLSDTDDQKVTAYTVQRHHYNGVERFLNWMCSLVVRSGLEIGNLDAQSMMDAAIERTGYTNFGCKDFIPRLEKLIQIAKESKATSLAHVLMREALLGRVAGRLKMEAYISRHPGILRVSVDKPVFIVGLPRTGTTLLQNLLSLQTGRRSLKFWEVTTPTPIMDDPEQDIIARKDIADRLLKLCYFMSPEMRAVHEITPESPEECWHMQANTFAIMNMDLCNGLKDYGDWLYEQDMRGPYLQYRRALQVMAWQQATETFVLKCPEHLWFIDSLLYAFPDASIIWTHRDPAQSIASYCSLVSLSRRTVYGEYNPVELGTHITKRFHEGISKAMQVAAEHKDRFYHVPFEQLCREPETVIRGICDKFDYKYADNLEEQIQTYLKSHRGDSKGSHRYNASMYGINPSDIQAKYADYIQAYDVRCRP